MVEQTAPQKTILEQYMLNPIKPGEVIYENDMYVFRAAKDDKEYDEIEQLMIEGFYDNARFKAFGITKDIAAIYIHQTYDWDKKYGNRVGGYFKATGELQFVYRGGAGDPAELPPEHPVLKEHKGFQRSKAISKRLEERAMRDFPEVFKLDRCKTNGGTIKPKWRGSPIGSLSWIFTSAHTKRLGYRYL